MILFLGELGRRKGCYDIPEVIKRVKEKIPNVKCIMAGAGSETDEEAIKKLIREKNIMDNIVFPGWIREAKKDKALKEADVFFLPSYNEGMPMSVLDAMGYGLPVVSTNVGGIPKIVHNGENGYCCDPGDIQGFTNYLVLLLSNDQYRKQAGKQSQKIVKEKYSFAAHIKQLEKLYESKVK